MYRFGMVCLLLLVLNVTGKSLAEENRLLEKSNHALLEALKTLSGVESEALVGQSVASAKSTCGEMEAYKACDGYRHELKGQATRDGETMITTYIISTPAYKFCKLKCENMGIPGCCEWSEDHSLCQFIAFADFTVEDSGFIRQYVSPTSFDYNKIPTRRASLCSVPNCVYEMALMNRGGSCDWNNLDSGGRTYIPGGGGDHTEEECTNWCLNEPACVYNALSPDGYCHGFRTCNHKPSGRGFTMKQKICKGVWEYSNRNGCKEVRDPKYCLDEWTGV